MYGVDVDSGATALDEMSTRELVPGNEVSSTYEELVTLLGSSISELVDAKSPRYSSRIAGVSWFVTDWCFQNDPLLNVYLSFPDDLFRVFVIAKRSEFGVSQMGRHRSTPEILFGHFCPTPRKGKIGGVSRSGWCRPLSLFLYL